MVKKSSIKFLCHDWALGTNMDFIQMLTLVHNKCKRYLAFGATQQYQNQNTKQANIILRRFFYEPFFVSQFVTLFVVLLAELNLC